MPQTVVRRARQETLALPVESALNVQIIRALSKSRTKHDGNGVHNLCPTPESMLLTLPVACRRAITHRAPHPGFGKWPGNRNPKENMLLSHLTERRWRFRKSCSSLFPISLRHANARAPSPFNFAA